MMSGRAAGLAAAGTALAAAAFFAVSRMLPADTGPLPDRLAAVDWSKFVAPCPIGDARGFHMEIKKIHKADVTGDRRPDTLLIDACASPTASNAETVEVFDGSSDPGAPRRLGILLEGDADYPRSVTVEVAADATIVIRSTGMSPTAARCCPDLRIVSSFGWRDGALVRLSHEVSPR